MNEEEFDGSLRDLIKCEDVMEIRERIKDIHPAELGRLIQFMKNQVPKGKNSQGLSHPDFRKPLRGLLEKSHENTRKIRKRLPNYPERGDPFFDGDGDE